MGNRLAGEQESSVSSGLLIGLRGYFHDLLNLQNLRNIADKVDTWGEGEEESGRENTVESTLDLSHIQKTIIEEEQRPLQHRGFTLDKGPGGLLQKVDSEREASCGLIRAEQHFFRFLQANEAAIGANGEPVAELLFRFSKLFSERGDPGRKADYLKKAWSILKVAGKQNGAMAGLILAGLVEACHQTHHFFESDKWFYAILEFDEKQAKSKLPELAEALNDLANYFSSCHEYDKATLLFDRALTGFFAGNMENNPVFLAVLNSAGSMYYQLQNFQEASRLYGLAIEVIEKFGLLFDPSTPILYHNSGLACCHLKRMDEARNQLVRSLISALQNGQEWVLWKSCYSLSYCFAQESNLSGSMFFGKLAIAVTLQSWQRKPDQAAHDMDVFLVEHMENLFKIAGQPELWEQIQDIITRHRSGVGDMMQEDSLQFFSLTERGQFQDFLLLAMRVKETILSDLSAKADVSGPVRESAKARFEKLESDFHCFLTWWDAKKRVRFPAG